MISLQNLSVGYDDRVVIQNLTTDIPQGKITTILGPNGCGKSTLLKTLACLMAPVQGTVTFGGVDLASQSSRDRARKIALLPQHPIAPDGVRVGDLVRRGRTPWRGVLSPWRKEDQQACDNALVAVGLQNEKARALAELSGGQRQRAWLALVLAQQTQTLLLDEPTTHLDLVHQIDLLQLLRDRNRDAGLTVISVLHDLNLAARFSDHLILLGPQGLVAAGSPDRVMSADNIKDGFNLPALITPDPITGAPMIVPH